MDSAHKAFAVFATAASEDPPLSARELCMVGVFSSFVLATAFGLAAVVSADDNADRAAKLKAIQKEVADADATFRKAWAKLRDPHQDDPEVEKLYEAFQAKQKAGFAEALAIAQAAPDSEAGFDALEWLLTTPRAYDLPVGKPAMELLAAHYSEDQRIGKAVAILAYYLPSDTNPAYGAAVNLLQTVVDQNPDRAARGQAALGLAWLAKRKFTMAEVKGRSGVNGLASDAERAFEKVLREYGDCSNLR